jgi:hypothetical protein
MKTYDHADAVFGFFIRVRKHSWTWALKVPFCYVSIRGGTFIA